jgi:hypothetical protein
MVFASDICGGLGEGAFGKIAEQDTTGVGGQGRLAVVATVGGVSPLSRMVLAAKKQEESD